MKHQQKRAPLCLGNSVIQANKAQNRKLPNPRSWPTTAAILFIAGLQSAVAQTPHSTSTRTLEVVKQRGALRCQLASPTPGFFTLDAAGKWSGMFVDLCRAVAVAIFDDTEKVEFRTVPTSARFTTLKSGETDLVMDGATFTASRDTQLGMSFPAVMFYDGQGFLVNVKSGVASAKDLGGATICVQAGGATTQQNISDYFRAIGKTYTPVTTDNSTVMAETYLRGGCDAMVNDKSTLAGRKSTFPNPADHSVLPETISKEPLGPMVRADDPQWTSLVRWVMLGLIAAEEMGVTARNAKEKQTSNDPQVRRLLGSEGEIGAGMGLAKDFMLRVVSKLGNYGEIYERNLGKNSPVALPRAGTQNDLWTRGGLLYAYPFQ